MRAPTLAPCLTTLGILTLLSSLALAADVEVQLTAGDSFVVKDSTGTSERLRVDEATGNVSHNGALFVHTTGTGNTFVGKGAGNTGTYGLGYNSAFGVYALRLNTAGVRNSAFGREALSNSTGARNSAFGWRAGEDQTTGSDDIYIGHPGFPGESNRIYIGESSVHTGGTSIAGIFGGTLPFFPAAASVLINSTGRLGTMTSSLRFEQDVHDMGEAGEVTMALRPVTFRYREDAGGDGKTREYGLIAEEVAEVAPELVVYDEQGRPYSVRYHVLPALLLNEIPKWRRTDREQQQTIEKLLESNALLAARLGALEADSLASR